MSVPPPAVKPSQSSRYFFLLLLGLVLGVIGTVMALRALEARKDHFPDSLMQVQQWHLEQLRSNHQSNRCAATDTVPHLQTLRFLANDVDPAFVDLREDARFAQHANRLRGTLNQALELPPSNCGGLQLLLDRVQNDCKACHQDFR